MELLYDSSHNSSLAELNVGSILSPFALAESKLVPVFCPRLPWLSLSSSPLECCVILVMHVFPSHSCSRLTDERSCQKMHRLCPPFHS